MARARKALAAANMLLQAGLREDAVSRAYYAVLHAAKAALLTVSLNPRSHRSVRSLFGLHLVKTGKLDKGLARILTAEQEDRELSDYDVTIAIGPSRAAQRVRDAAAFVSRISAYLSER